MERTEAYSLIEGHYHLHFNELVKKLRNATGGHHNAEDTVQEAYTRALTYWNTYNPDQPLDRWFGTILRNCIKDTQKDNILKGMVLEDLMSLPEPTRDDVLNNVMASEVMRDIEASSKRDKSLLHWFLVDGYTSQEISEFTGMKAETIRQIVTRFCKKYRD